MPESCSLMAFVILHEKCFVKKKFHEKLEDCIIWLLKYVNNLKTDFKIP